MNKKISVLDLANMKEDEMPKKIKFRDGIFNYQENEKKYKKEDSEAEVWLDWETEIEILEDNTEEIEEIEIDENNYIHTKDGAWKGRKMDLVFAKIINKLIENVREMKEGKE